MPSWTPSYFPFRYFPFRFELPHELNHHPDLNQLAQLYLDLDFGFWFRFGIFGMLPVVIIIWCWESDFWIKVETVSRVSTHEIGIFYRIILLLTVNRKPKDHFVRPFNSYRSWSIISDEVFWFTNYALKKSSNWTNWTKIT